MRPVLSRAARRVQAFWLIAGLVLVASGAAAQQSGASPAWEVPAATGPAMDVPTERQVDASLIAETPTVQPGGTVTLGLHFEIAEGWHTYWRYAGDSGAPTQIDWTLPAGVSAGPIQWPYPERLPVGPLMNFGYRGQVTHLVELAVPADWPVGRPIALLARAQWLVCADICIPEEATLALSLPVAAAPVAADPAVADRFAAARARLPVDAGWPSRHQASDGRVTLEIDLGAPVDGIGAASFFPDRAGWIAPSAPQAVAADGSRLVVRMGAEPDPLNPPAPGSDLTGVLVLEETAADAVLTRAIRIAAPAGAVAALSADAVSIGMAAAGSDAWAGLSLWQVLGLALVGGLILNLMPCVFPVLSIKALALVRHRDAPAGRRRWHGLAYTAGVLVCFSAIGVVLLALKAGGMALGWGFQLQSPVFVGILALVLLAVGLSLSGVFTLGGALAGLGQGLAARDGLAGSFFTGALAAVVATPCTAPFMGTAVGFALAAPAGVALAVLLALGFGLALPFLALTMLPGAARLLPRPGKWMERLKQALAFPMYASAAWLVWVLSQQTGPTGLALVLAALVLVAMAAWLIGLAGSTTQGPAGRRLTGAPAVLMLVLAVALTAKVPAEPSDPAAVAEMPPPDHLAEPFTQARLDELRAEGRPVFVNITAAWCITCLVNERVALTAGAARDRLDAGEVAYLKGDWTNRDPAITAYLAEFGRSGVPLYVVYPAAGGAPEVLPQILTPAALAAAFSRALDGAGMAASPAATLADDV